VSKTTQLQLLKDEVAQCTRCPELAKCRSQTVFGIGNPDADVLFIGEAPGAAEDQQGEPFVGQAGKLLDDIITKGLQLRREDVFLCNILCCRPPGNRNPLSEETAHCRPFLDRTLEIVKPKVICCLGAVAAHSLLGIEEMLASLRGKVHDCNGIAVVCTYHPAYLLRNPAAKEETWKDMQLLTEAMRR
jgi:DNA polymerase